MARLHYLSEADLEEVIRLSRRAFPGDPSPDLAFVLRGDDGRNLIQSALWQPRWSHHRRLPEKAAALHYHLSKNHPFVDGNKRFALTAMAVFLARNQALLLATNEDLLNWSVDVADGLLTRAESERFVRRRTIRGSWSAATFERWARGLTSDASELLVVVRAAAWMAEHRPEPWLRDVGTYAAALVIEAAVAAGIPPPD